jgi:hypothetical protein
VVFAHVHATALVWLNVVVYPAFARVRFAAALPSALQSTDPLGGVVGMYAEMLDPVTWKMTFVSPPGAAGVVPLKLGAGTTEPLTLIELPPAALIKRGKRAMMLL